MDKITVGVLTVSDRCDRKEAVDVSGPNLVAMIEGGIIKYGEVARTGLVPDSKTVIEGILKIWCEEGIDVILTTGGTGISERDVTPEATLALSQREIPGISQLIFKRSSSITPLAALSRGVACIVGKSLIINLPGSTKAAKECLEAVAEVIPHAIDLISGKIKKVEKVHAGMKKSSVVADNAANRARQSVYPCIRVGDAQNIILDRINCIKKQKVISYENAHNYVLAEDVVSLENIPLCDVSLMDGYAVCSSDKSTKRAVVGVVNTGDSCDLKISPGSCARVSTGAIIPDGADAVVKVEDTELVEVNEDKKGEKDISLKYLPVKNESVRFKGSEFKLGQKILTFGTRLDSAAVALLGVAGVTSVRVFDKPLVAVISTGNELVNPGERIKPGQVRDVNRITLINLLKEENFEAVDLGICVDEPNALRDTLEKGFLAADIVVTTGSMSMGERDYLKEILISDFNAEICFGRVFLKPGKPTSFAVLMFEGKPKLWFGLPGNPASAFVTSHLFLLPALKKISGQRDVLPVAVDVNLKGNIIREDRPQYVRGVVAFNTGRKEWEATFIKDQASCHIQNCINVNCLILIPEKSIQPVENCTPNPKPAENSLLSEQPVFKFGKMTESKNSCYKAFLIGKVHIPPLCLNFCLEN